MIGEELTAFESNEEIRKFAQEVADEDISNLLYKDRTAEIQETL